MRTERGSYTIEGALAICIFTVCMMAVISIISIIRVEGEVQDALNRTAMQISQYSYAMEKAALSSTGQMVSQSISDAEADALSGLPSELVKVWNENKADLGKAVGGAALAKTLTAKNFSRKSASVWLEEEGVKGGFSGMQFSTTSLLNGGKLISVSVVYKLKVNTYGLFSKVLTIHECAETYALLPEEYLKGAGSGKNSSGKESSIWNENNFVRGQYFLKKIRENNAAKEVKPGQGIDLYDEKAGHYVEGFSMNVFSSMYKDRSEITKTMDEYASKLNKDIKNISKTIEMADGSTCKKTAAQKKTMIVVLPEEAESDAELQAVLGRAAAGASKKGITVQYLYDQKALAGNAETTEEQK